MKILTHSGAECSGDICLSETLANIFLSLDAFGFAVDFFCGKTVESVSEVSASGVSPSAEKH